MAPVKDSSGVLFVVTPFFDWDSKPAVRLMIGILKGFKSKQVLSSWKEDQEAEMTKQVGKFLRHN